jgi:hypothetical protein
MALLYYENLYDHRPEVALSRTYNNLGDFYSYLKQVYDHLEKTRPALPFRPAGALLRLLPPTGKDGTEQARRLRELLERPPRTLRLYQEGHPDQALIPLATYPSQGLLQLPMAPPAGPLLLAEQRDGDRGPLRGLPCLTEPIPPLDMAIVAAAAKQEEQAADGAADQEKGEAPAANDPVLRRYQEIRPLWIEVEEPRGEHDRTLEQFFDDQVEAVHEDRRRDPYADPIRVHKRDRERHLLCLERLPLSARICVRPNTYVIKRQMEAIRDLQDRPGAAHKPLLDLFQRQDHVRWPALQPEPPETWYILNEEDRPGTEEQRHFVTCALATPDFALLEGPPGSGKTTAIVELILQIVARGQRALLCASTHVAVDNVIERLKDPESKHRDRVLAVRIGSEDNVRSELVRPYRLTHMARTESEALYQQLARNESRTVSQQEMLDFLRPPEGEKNWQETLLDTAQLVCGTTIGILQHPRLKKGIDFDYLILDEASKTPFGEFLVPALRARRWIIVGDRRQLSPYVEEAWIRCNIEAALPDPALGPVCLDVFEARRDRRRRAVLVACEDKKRIDAYLHEAEGKLPNGAVQVLGDDTADPFALAGASLVLGAPAQLLAWEDALPPRTLRVRAEDPALSDLHRRHAAQRGAARDLEEDWAGAVSWRLVREYELRLLTELAAEEEEEGAGPGARYRQEWMALLPRDNQRVRDAVERVRRVALPSVLESLQVGLGASLRGGSDNALALGLPQKALAERLVPLTYQHRMHPEISRFPREHIYQRDALNDPPYQGNRRRFPCPRYQHRAQWIAVDGREEADPIRNQAEARVVLKELSHLADWARTTPGPGGRPWSVAVLTFYRGQERLLRDGLRRFTGERDRFHQFCKREGERALLQIDLCTVDRFQGHEADIVLLSFVLTRRTGFLNSPNRLNVALTRARYQLLLVGKRAFFRSKDCRSPLLQALAQDLPADIDFSEDAYEDAV